MKSVNIIALSAAASLVTSLLSGLNQITGSFSKISLPTAILSVVLAVIVVLAFPTKLGEKLPGQRTILSMSFKAFSILLAGLILAVGVGPFLGKTLAAAKAKHDGFQLVDLHRYGLARIQMDRAVR